MSDLTDLPPEASATDAVAMNTDSIEQQQTERSWRAALAALSQREGELSTLTAQLRRAYDELEQRAQQYAAESAAREEMLRQRTEQLHALTRRLVQVQEEERRALARDLHDTSGQAMTVINIGLAMLKREAASDKMLARIEQLRGAAGSVAEDLHRLSVNLRPSSLDRYGLAPAIEELIKSIRHQTDIEFDLNVTGLDERLPSDLEIALYRIVQEACTNISRHAGATRATISLHGDGESLELIVTDDGAGFDVHEALSSSRLGLLGMAERAEMLGGELRIESSPGQGARIVLRAPVGRGAAAVPATPEAPASAPAVAAVVDPPTGAEPSAAPAASVGASVAAFEAAELARAKALSDTLVDITAEMVRCSTADELLDLVLRRSAQAVGCESAAILCRRNAAWVVTHAFGAGAELMLGRPLPEQDTRLLTQVERTRDIVVINDTGAGSRTGPGVSNVYRVLSLASIPLIASDKVVGVACYVYHSAPIAFKQAEVEFLQRLARVAALALENVQLRETEKQQRDRLAHRVEELQTLLDVLPVGIAIAYDPLCKDIRTNPALTHMLGLPDRSNVSLSADEPERPDYRVLADGRELTEDELPMQAAAASGVAVRDMVIDVVRGDGKTVTLLSCAAPLFDAEGKPRGAVGGYMDITERRRMKAEAAAAAERLAREQAIHKAITTHYPKGGVVVLDRDLRFLAAGGEALASLGFEPEKMIGKTIYEVYGADTAARLLPYYRTALLGKSIDEDIAYRGRVFSAAYRPIFDDQGRVIAMLGASREITERAGLEAELRAANEELAAQAEELAAQSEELAVQAEELRSQADELTRSEAALREAAATLEQRVAERTAALLAANERLRFQAAMLENINDALVVVDENNRILEWNRSAEALYGWRAEEALGQVGNVMFGSRMTPEQRTAIFAKLGATGYWRGELLHSRRDGTPLTVEANSISVRDETGALRHVTVLRDVTERRQAEERLRGQKERLEVLHEIDRAILSRMAPADIAQVAIEKVLELAGGVRGAVTLFDDAAARAEILTTAGVSVPGTGRGHFVPYEHYLGIDELKAGRVHVIEDFRAVPDEMPWKESRLAAGFLSSTLVPLIVEGRVIGGMALNSAAPGALPPDVMTFMRQVADSLAVAIHEARLAQEVEAQRDQLEALTRRLVAAQERERSLVADRLFNQASQVLAALQMQLAALDKEGAGSRRGQPSGELVSALDRAMHELHALANQLRPVGLDRSTLAAVLHQHLHEFGEAHGLDVEFDAAGAETVKLPVDVTTAVYRAVEEGLKNVSRHAQAGKVRLTLRRTGARLVITLQDDGVGFDPTDAERGAGVGLIAMHQRLKSVGGALEVRSGKDGTQLMMLVPLSHSWS